MSISANFPNVFPSLELNFAQSQQLDPRVTFSRSTTAPYYDGKTSALAEQNLLLQSQTFGTSWIIQNATQTANSITAPDGTSTGTTLTSTSSVSTSVGAYQSVSTIIGSTLAIYAKVGTSNFIGVTSSSGGQSYANFNLNTGVVSSSSNCTASIINAGNGWYRCVIANTTTAGTNQFFIAPKDADPSGNPWQFGTCASGNYVYIWGAQLEQRSSATAYNATTTSALTNYIPQLLTAPINQPRFDFNPTTGESLGLLIEQSSTNLLTYSQDFSNGVWTKTNTTVTTSADIAPDGTQTMNLLQETTATGQHYAITGTILTSGTQYTTTIYAKAYGQSLLGICYGYDSGGANFNLSTGAVGTVDAGVTATITAVGNGVYRCSMTRTPGSNSALIFQLNGRASSYTGNGYSGIYIWGAQVEALAFPTSYIPTTSAQVTRASDNASMTGTNFSSWYNQAEGTLYAEASTVSNGNACVYGIGDSTSNIIRMFKQNGNQAVYQVVKDATFSANLGMATTWTSGYGKIASVYKTDDFATSYNGGTSVTDTSGAVPIVNTVLTIGIGAGVASLNGYIKKIAYYPIRVTNTQLQALTGS